MPVCDDTRVHVNCPTCTGSGSLRFDTLRKQSPGQETEAMAGPRCYNCKGTGLVLANFVSSEGVG